MHNVKKSIKRMSRSYHRIIDRSYKKIDIKPSNCYMCYIDTKLYQCSECARYVCHSCCYKIDTFMKKPSCLNCAYTDKLKKNRFCCF